MLTTKWIFTPLRFEAGSKFLRRACNIAIQEIVKNINARLNVDGDAQKKNSPATILLKGHDHPLIGGAKDSPLLAKVSTYDVNVKSITEAVITIKRKRADAGYYVTEKGYEFFGFTDNAIDRITEEFTRAIITEIKLQWR